jgi:hypothetical protein
MPSEPLAHPAASSTAAAPSGSAFSGATGSSTSAEMVASCVEVSANVGEISDAVSSNASWFSCVRSIARYSACRTAGSVCGPEHPCSTLEQVASTIWFCAAVRVS